MMLSFSGRDTRHQRSGRQLAVVESATSTDHDFFSLRGSRFPRPHMSGHMSGTDDQKLMTTAANGRTSSSHVIGDLQIAQWTSKGTDASSTLALATSSNQINNHDIAGRTTYQQNPSSTFPGYTVFPTRRDILRFREYIEISKIPISVQLHL